MSSILKTFLLAALAYFVIPAIANGDPCIKAITDAETQCKGFVSASTQASAKKAQAIGKKLKDNGERGPAAVAKIKSEVNAVYGASLTAAATQCRGLIPLCAQVCGSTEPCFNMIDDLTYQIEAAAQQGVQIKQ
jgi:hypothetical protein